MLHRGQLPAHRSGAGDASHAPIIRGTDVASHGEVSGGEAQPAAETVVHLLDRDLRPVATSEAESDDAILHRAIGWIRSGAATLDAKGACSFTLENCSIDVVALHGEWGGFAVLVHVREAQRTFERTCDRLSLSARQKQVLRLVAQGMTRASIAKELNISQTTVQSHIRNIGLKMGVTRRGEIIARAFDAA